MTRRVVITGAGVVSPIGIGMKAFSESLRAGRAGDGPIQGFSTDDFPFKRACAVKGFNARELGTQQLDPFIQYAVKAAHEALEDARFTMEQTDPYRVAISVSSSKGGVHTLDRFKERFHKRPSAILGARIYSSLVPNFAAQWIARRWKIRGPAKCYIAACATGTVAVEQGALMVAEGEADFCLAGASDASIVPLMLAGYRQMKALSDSTMKPFHRERDGFLVGEGAGIVFLESLESAKSRGARIYAEVLGGAQGTDSSHALHFNPNEDALSRTVTKLMRKIGRMPGEIDYVNLHGTATRAGDLYETEQLKKAFGTEAMKIPMSATKAMTGHMLGASGAVEIIACLAAIQENFVPPTVGLLNGHDPACDLDYVAGRSRTKQVKTAVSLSMGFGGHVAAIALGRV